MPAKPKRPKRALERETNQGPAANATVGVFAELYPEFSKRIVEIWDSDVPFVKQKVARLKVAFEKRAESWRSVLCRRYGLTDSEASVAIHIIEGGSVGGYANIAKCSEATVRTHLKSIFRKTKLSRQSELATLFITVPVARRI